MKTINILMSVAILSLGMSNIAIAKNDKAKELPPGLQKKLQKGQPLPPGWQKKVAVGHVLEQNIYDHRKVISRDGDFATISIEGEIFKVIENTREIVDIIRRNK
ncbi:hypothetical protein [Shewanella gaetbuli]|uniref:Nickel/cobalt transporter regulator n=1 Tax=Shewanella gaetbuli TaxID=220752 RepID=A0A9X1ZR32_9GAMM|nr:hypothetical protein [Shewanella gaetbuli]MCL1142543.1 hypothetical protein [Shewanella gaetbuli]